jgi:hypothetical protein
MQRGSPWLSSRAMGWLKKCDRGGWYPGGDFTEPGRVPTWLQKNCSRALLLPVPLLHKPPRAGSFDRFFFSEKVAFLVVYPAQQPDVEAN